MASVDAIAVMSSTLYERVGQFEVDFELPVAGIELSGAFVIRDCLTELVALQVSIAKIHKQIAVANS